MKKSNTAAVTQFQVNTVYGFKERREAVLLGHLLQGKVQAGDKAQVWLNSTTLIGEWSVKRVLDIDFINNQDSTDVIGLELSCETPESYNLLQSLRVYGEVLTIK